MAIKGIADEGSLESEERGIESHTIIQNTYHKENVSRNVSINDASDENSEGSEQDVTGK